jgi:putative transposase
MEDLVVLLGAIEERTISPKGIEFMGLFYNSRELMQLLNSGITGKTRRARFKYNPNDISRIHVYDELEDRFIEVEALNQQYTKGLSEWQHQVVMNQVKKTKGRVDGEGLLEAKAEINSLVEKDKKEMFKKRKASPRIGKWGQVSSNAEIMREKNTDANPLEIEGATVTSKTNISDSDHGISDIGTCCGTSKPTNLKRISSGMTIIESTQEVLTEEEPAYSKSNLGLKNGTDELGYAPKDETEFDMGGWSVSSKTEWQSKRNKVKTLSSPKEGNHE